MAENNVVFTNNTAKQLYLQDQHFWYGTSVTAPADKISTRSKGEGKQQATANGELRFATVYVDSEVVDPTTCQFISAFDISFPKEFGPYGTQSPKNYSLILGPDEKIKEVIVRHGFIVDAIGFVVVNDKTGTTYTKIFGGNIENETKIPLKSDEHITQISGTYGRYQNSNSDNNVGTLTIHTNFKQYGPYGKEQFVQNPLKFESPIGPIIGFFGRNDDYIQSIGGYISTNAASKAYAECGPIGPIDWDVVEDKLGTSKPSDVYVDPTLGLKEEATAHDNGDATVAMSVNH